MSIQGIACATVYLGEAKNKNDNYKFKSISSLILVLAIINVAICRMLFAPKAGTGVTILIIIKLDTNIP